LTLLRARKFTNGNGNGKDFARAGDMPKEFWQLEFRKIVAEIITPLMERQEKLMEKQTDLIEKTHSLLQQAKTSQETGKAHVRI
jgi:hypothetical protein